MCKLAVMFLCLGLISTPAYAEQFVLIKPLKDSNKDGIIELGSQNKKIYKVDRLYGPVIANGKYIYSTEKPGSAPTLPKPLEASMPIIERPRLSDNLIPIQRTMTSYAKYPTRLFSNGSYINSQVFFKNDWGDVATNYTFSDLKLKRSGMLFRSYGGSMSDSTFERIEALDYGRYGLLRFRNKSNNIVIKDVKLLVTGINTSPGDIPAGIGFAGKSDSDSGSNILMKNIHIEGLTSKHTSGFQNADGIATENSYSNVRYENVYVARNTDAGIDNKAANTTCSNVIAEENRRNFKLWYGITCDGPVTSINPGRPGNGTQAHFFLTSKSDGSSVYRFKQITFKSNNAIPLFVNGSVKNKAKIIIESYKIDVPPNTPMVFDPYKTLTIDWGSQGPPKLK